MVEEYRIIKDFPKYAVSNFGNVINILKNKQKISTVKAHGYLDLNLYKNNKRTHRTVHSLVAEAFLKNDNNYPCVDHIDGNPKNNYVDNLRYVTVSQNLMNSKLHKHNTSGYKGVFWSNSKNRWLATINVNRNRKHLGYFKNIEDAVKARKIAEDCYFGIHQRFNSKFDRLNFQYKQLKDKYSKLYNEIEILKNVWNNKIIIN